MKMHPLPTHITLPEHLRHDGAITAPRLGVTLIQFTDLLDGPSKGASFSIEAQDLNDTTLRRKLRAVRQAFRVPATVQRRPAMCPPEKPSRLALEIPETCK